MLLNLLVIVFLILIFALTIYFASKDYFHVLMGFLIALLFHELILRWLVNLLRLPQITVSILSLWKEVVFFALILVAIPQTRKDLGRIIRIFGRRNLILGGLLVIWGTGMMLLSPNRLAGIAAFRDYFEPMLVLALVLLAQPGEIQLRKYLKVWLIIGAGIALLGIWQALFWGADEYIQFGFGQPRMEAGIPPVSILGRRLLRPPSSVTGPNELGMHMVLLSIFTLKYLIVESKRHRGVGAVLFILYSACLFYTRSRSDLIAYILCVVLVTVLSFRGFGTVYRRNPMIWVTAGLIGVLLIGGLLVATGMIDFVLDTVQTLRTQDHIVDITESIVYLAENPGGVGMGLVGPRIGAFFPETAAFHAEGSLFQIALDMGVFGLVLWLAFIFSLMSTIYRRMRSNKNDFTRAIQTTAVIGWIGGLFVFLILPLMQSLTLMSWMWFLLGLGLTASNPEGAWNRTSTRIGKGRFPDQHNGESLLRA